MEELAVVAVPLLKLRDDKCLMAAARCVSAISTALKVSISDGLSGPISCAIG